MFFFRPLFPFPCLSFSFLPLFLSSWHTLFFPFLPLKQKRWPTRSLSFQQNYQICWLFFPLHCFILNPFFLFAVPFLSPFSCLGVCLDYIAFMPKSLTRSSGDKGTKTETSYFAVSIATYNPPVPARGHFVGQALTGKGLRPI